MTTVTGYVEKIVYRNPENGYTVLSLTAGKDEEEITCVGIFVSVNEGDYLKVTGEETVHPSYGDQLKVSSYEQSVPTDVIAITRYLSSGAIKGVGEALANRIVGTFGTDTFRVIEEEPELLVKVKGISERIAINIHNQFHEVQGMRDAMIFLQKYDIPSALAVKIYNFYGPALYEVIKNNPYRLAEDIQGVGFATADAIAERVGIEQDSEYRLKAGVLYELGLALANGHCCYPKHELIELSEQLLGVSGTRLKEPLETAVLERKAIVEKREDQEYVYPPAMYYMELNVARMLKNLDNHRFCTAAKAEEKAARALKGFKTSLEEEQRKAVEMSFEHGLFILTGGPGTGKTTTIRAIIKLLESEGLEYLLAAPTGRAAKRMTEATGVEARTIHRLLEFSNSQDATGEAGFERNADNPLEADAIIIDEMSMVDISLMNALLKAVPPGTRLILVGDENQLPSVGPGSVLHDILAAGVFANVRLKKIFRQGEESHIIINAHKINAGEYPDLETGHPDFFLIRRNKTADIQGVIARLLTEKLPKHLHCEPLDIQVLSPMRKGELGVETLNRLLQNYMNPKREDEPEVESHGFKFRVGDKVMQIKNNYDIEWYEKNKRGFIVKQGTGIFNGDMGIIRRISTVTSTITIEFDDGRFADYPYSGLEEIELAYAVTVHKSQGSEYPAVILPLLTGPRQLFHRNILYTAVTRAKKSVAIIGDPQTVTGMIDNVREQIRYTTLCERIQEIYA
jgi:exodeoxyribonuclease V alpha subunit